jgi:ATP-dependent Clp protease ATP-binding subunit ClpA
MMFERFTDGARATVVQAQEHARRLGHGFIGCEHLLLAVASADEAASVVLREHGLTPERVEAEVIRLAGPGQAASLFSTLDREALAFIGIDLDTVRARIEAAFGPGALTRAAPRTRHPRRPAWHKGPVARVLRRRHRHGAAPAACPRPSGHIPFTPQAKKSLERSLHEAKALHNGYIGVEHLALALVASDSGMMPPILSALGTSATALRTAILDRYRQAS